MGARLAAWMASQAGIEPAICAVKGRCPAIRPLGRGDILTCQADRRQAETPPQRQASQAASLPGNRDIGKIGAASGRDASWLAGKESAP